jgi:RNA polymerase sigma-70 factor (ECF subfamily)
MLSAIPRLRAFAMSLVRNPDRADDLVQETLVRACQNIRQFTKGTNMVAWLITILRNECYSERRRRCRELEDADGMYARTLVAPAQQLSHPECRALCDALAKLPHEMREPLLLVTTGGLSYSEAAQACGCELGTVKSRVNRGRARLASMLALETPADFAADPLSCSVAAHVEQCRFPARGMIHR